MEKIIVRSAWFVVLGFLIIASNGFVQSSRSNAIDTTYINPAGAYIADTSSKYSDSLSNVVDMWSGGKHFLTGLQIDSALVGDTLYIQTAEYYNGTTDTTFHDAYYTKSDGTEVQMHIPVNTGRRIGINPLWSEVLSRFIRYRSDAADTNTNRKIITFGE